MMAQYLSVKKSPPDSLLILCREIFLLPLFRTIACGYLWMWNHTIRNVVKEEKEKEEDAYAAPSLPQEKTKKKN